MPSPLRRAAAPGLAVALVASAVGTADDQVDLKVGDPAPTFQLRDETGATWSSSDHLGKKWVVTH